MTRGDDGQTWDDLSSLGWTNINREDSKYEPTIVPARWPQHNKEKNNPKRPACLQPSVDSKVPAWPARGQLLTEEQ
jgi:hypothetical protein